MRFSAQLVDLINSVSQIVASVNNIHFSWCQNAVCLTDLSIAAYAQFPQSPGPHGLLQLMV